MIHRYLDLSTAAYLAFNAGVDRERSRERMSLARRLRDDGLSRETICVIVRSARRWHRSYLKNLSKALQP